MITLGFLPSYLDASFLRIGPMDHWSAGLIVNYVPGARRRTGNGLLVRAFRWKSIY